MCRLAAALGHRVEAEGRLALGRELREEPGLAQLVGDPGGVLGDLGQRHVGLRRHEPGRGGLGLQASQPPEVGAERHEPQVGLVPEQRPPGPPGSRPPRRRSRPCAGRSRRSRAPAGRRGGGLPSRSSGSGPRRQCREDCAPDLSAGRTVSLGLGVRRSQCRHALLQRRDTEVTRRPHGPRPTGT